MGELKSAFDKALERAEKMKASPEELARFKYVPEGERLAASYLRGECDLNAELGKYEEGVKGHVIQGARDTLLRNIDLPRNEAARSNSERAMAGLELLVRNKSRLEAAYAKMGRIFDHYEREGQVQRQQAYQTLKRDFESRLQQAVQQQRGAGAQIRVNVESVPEFREEWRRLSSQFDAQYYKLLSEYKQEIAGIS